jgi:hypothetical protein
MEEGERKAFMWQYIYGRGRKKPRIKVLFKLLVYDTFEVIV